MSAQIPFLRNNEDDDKSQNKSIGPSDASRLEADEARRRRGRSFSTLIGEALTRNQSLLGGEGILGG